MTCPIEQLRHGEEEAAAAVQPNSLAAVMGRRQRVQNRKSLWEELQRSRWGAEWRRALAIRQAAATGFAGGGDALVRRYVRYLRLRGQGAAAEFRAAELHPDFAAADALWENFAARLPIQLLLLGGCSAREIRRRLDLAVGTLRAIEALRFDVRPLLGTPAAIVAQVIAPEADAGRDAEAAQMRTAYFGGPFAALALVESKHRLPGTEAERLADAAIVLHAKFVQVSEMPLRSAQATTWLESYLLIRQEEARLQLERDKLSFRMQRWRERLDLERRRTRPIGLPNRESKTTAEPASTSS